MMIIIWVLIFVAFIASFFVQAKMSNLKPMWVGLVLPIHWIFITILFTLMSIVIDFQDGLGGPDIIIGGIAVFIIFNVPTVIYIIIYLICRLKASKDEY